MASNDCYSLGHRIWPGTLTTESVPQLSPHPACLTQEMTKILEFPSTPCRKRCLTLAGQSRDALTPPAPLTKGWGAQSCPSDQQRNTLWSFPVSMSRGATGSNILNQLWAVTQGCVHTPARCHIRLAQGPGTALRAFPRCPNRAAGTAATGKQIHGEPPAQAAAQ